MPNRPSLTTMDDTHSGVAATNEPAQPGVKPELLILTEKQSRNFWRKVDKSHVGGCWLWTAAKIPHGYGYFSMDRRPTYVHRLSYQIHKGPIPPGINVCHNCPSGDNPSCVNPEHLWLGTQMQNQHDMIRKGRDRKATGDRAGGRTKPESFAQKVTREMALAILASTDSHASLGRKYGISTTTVWSIRTGKTWKHLTLPSSASAG